MLTSFVLLLAFLFRFLRLSDYPVSLSMDEIAVGWDANSILQTGRDQYGKFLPLVFKSVGDYKTPVSIYLDTVSIKVFGLNELGVRFPAAFLGALTPIVFVYLLRKLKFSKLPSAIGGVWFAISPIHSFLSRTSFDGIIALFFLITSLVVFLSAIEKKSSLRLVFSIFLASLAFWSYHAERIFVPLLAIFLTISFRKKLKFVYKKKAGLILCLMTILLASVPFIYLFFLGEGIFGRASNLWLGHEAHGVIPIIGLWASQYLNYFDYQLWFGKALNLTPKGYFDLGILYYADIILFFPGIYYLLKNKNKFLKNISLFWFLVGPIPGSLTTGGINAGRIVIWLPFFGIVVASAVEKINKKIFLIYVPFLIWCIGYFINMFAFNFPKYYADLWHYGYKEAAVYACQNYKKYDKIILTDKYGIDWPSVKTIPYLYILFYCKWDPDKYLMNKNLFNFELRQPQWRIDSKEKNWLLIGSRWDFPEGFDEGKIIKKIYFPESAYGPKAAFYFVETKTH